MNKDKLENLGHLLNMLAERLNTLWNAYYDCREEENRLSLRVFFSDQMDILNSMQNHINELVASPVDRLMNDSMALFAPICPKNKMFQKWKPVNIEFS